MGLLERSASEEVAGLDDGQLVERASESPRTSGESELSSPESSVVETEKIPGASQTDHSHAFYLKIYLCGDMLSLTCQEWNAYKRSTPKERLVKEGRWS